MNQVGLSQRSHFPIACKCDAFRPFLPPETLLSRQILMNYSRPICVALFGLADTCKHTHPLRKECAAGQSG